MGIPAIIDTNNLDFNGFCGNVSYIFAMAHGKMCGLTAKNIVSASSTTLPFSVNILAPFSFQTTKFSI